MKIIIAPDSFKGSLSAREAAEAIAAGARQAHPASVLSLLPLGDGGEGTIDSLVAAVSSSRKIWCRVIGPLGEPVKAYYALLGNDGRTAVVEMAAASGLTLVPPERRDPRYTTTYGTGELIDFASHEPSVAHLIICLGGSATNDAGVGALQALGVRFFDRAGRELAAPVYGVDLSRIVRAEWQNSSIPSRQIDVTIACDVTNPLCGPNGASLIFGPQKGADPAMAQELDQTLLAFAPVLDRIWRGRGGGAEEALADKPGAGAAGGLAAGLMAYFPWATLAPGIDIVLDAVGFNEALHGADLVLTGEGKLDSQTLSGKAISGVLARAKTAGVPVIAFAGDVEPGAAQALKPMGLTQAVSLRALAASTDDAMARAAELLQQAAADTLTASVV